MLNCASHKAIWQPLMPRILLSGILISSAPLPSKADAFAVVKPQFSGSVIDDGSYTVIDPADKNNEISRAKLTKGRLYFSFTVLCTDKSVEYLREEGRLDVYAVIYAGGIQRETLPIGISQQNWAENGTKFLDLFAAEGFFKWGTFMFTRRIQYPSIEITIKDANHNIIRREVVKIVQ